MKTIFMNTENSKASEPHKFALNSPQILNLASSNKHLQNLSIYHSRKNIKQQYKSKKLKIIALRAMMSLNYLMVLLQSQTFKVISSTS